MITNISTYLSNFINVKEEYIYLFIISAGVYITMKIISIIIIDFYLKHDKTSKEKYIHKQKIKFIMNNILIILLLIIWEQYIQNFITLISFISAGATIALREIIFNYFSGIYIKFKKPFKIEDRIEINNHKGDVIRISNMSFEILEVGEEQSTGKTIHIPNSYVFQYPLKNYVKPFKYIWHEMDVNVPLDVDIKETKRILYRIINSNQTIKHIPTKMRKQINQNNSDYRIYFNKFTPYIYTRLEKDHLTLSIRFLIHPKKVRNTEDEIWLSILRAVNESKLQIYKS